MTKFIQAIFIVCSVSVLLFSSSLLAKAPLSSEEREPSPQELAAQEAEILEKIADCEKTLIKTGLINVEDGPDIKRYCTVQVRTQDKKFGRFAKRLINEKMTEINPFVITPHKQSYILPAVISDNFNRKPYGFSDEFSAGLEELEAKYQVSFKVPLTEPSWFVPGDGFYFGMTIQAWWQVYSDDISKPFRETNYQPEIFYMAPLPLQVNEGNLLFTLHFEHQSNGQHQLLSRSWNRVLASITYEKDNYVISFKPWYRLKEEGKTNPLQPTGDDNPDIQDFLGRYEVTGAYAFSNDLKLSYLMRKNWQTGKGALELNLTYPLWGRLIGMAQIFTGYGESLIDYNHKQTKIGLGIALTEIF